MLETIKNYLMLGLLAALAILAYMFGRRGDKISDLQFRLADQSLKNDLAKQTEKVVNDERTYDEAVKRYNAKRDAYNKLLSKSGKSI